MNASRVATSPFNCYWVVKGSEACIDRTAYAVCARAAGPRVVKEDECARCAFWRDPEPPADEAVSRAA